MTEDHPLLREIEAVVNGDYDLPDDELERCIQELKLIRDEQRSKNQI
jgi:hypothetical protein